MCEGHHHEEDYCSGEHREGNCDCPPVGCCCHSGSEQELGFQRRFRSREERAAELEAYLKELEAEAQGVREALQALRSTPS